MALSKNVKLPFTVSYSYLSMYRTGRNVKGHGVIFTTVKGIGIKKHTKSLKVQDTYGKPAGELLICLRSLHLIESLEDYGPTTMD